MTTKSPTRGRRFATLLATTALAGMLTSGSALAQSVAVTGDVITSNFSSPDWVVGGPLLIGINTIGVLTIDNGGTVSNTSATIGYFAGSAGSSVTVSGSGSKWTNTSSLMVGLSGRGSLTVANGGAVSATSVDFGNAFSNTASTLNIGAASGEAAVGSGTIDSGSVKFNSTGSVIVFNHTDADYTFTPVISGNGALRLENGVTKLSGNNTFSGGVTVAGGTLSLQHNNAAGTGTITTTGSVIDYGDGVNIANPVNINSNTTQLQVLTGASATQSGGISETAGPRPLEKIGDGTLVLTGANTYTGVTTISAGVLNIQSGTGLGTTAGGTIVADGAALELQGDIAIGAEALTLNGAGISGGGAVRNVAGYNSISGAITLGSDSRINTDANVLLLTGGITGAGHNLTVGGAGVTDIYTGVIATGTGGLVKDGSGVLRLYSANSFTGDVTVNDGKLMLINGSVIHDSVAVTVNAGTLDIQTSETIGSLAGAGNVEMRFAETLTTGGNNADTEFSGVISGTSGKLVKQGTGTFTLSGNNTYTGLTTVSAGTLVNNGTISVGGLAQSAGKTTNNGAIYGAVIINGGILNGSGTFGGALTINSGGTFAPGNSIGTTSVGSATFGSGSVFEVELKSGGFTAGVHNDLLDATGAVTIDSGATVHVKPENGTDDGSTYTLGTYTIIAAAGGVTGTFGAVTDDFAFLNFALGYEANNVYLRSALAATSFCVSGMTANQCAAGDGVFSLGSGGLYTAVMNLSGAAAPGALDQLSGEIHASTQTVLVDDSRFARDVTTGRTRASFGGVGSVTLPMLAYVGGSDPLAVSADPDRMAVWGQAFGALRSWTGAGATAMTGAAGGLLAGADTALSDTVRLGLFGGYAHSGFRNTGLASTGSAGSWQFGIYGGGQWDGFGLRGGASYAWHRIDTSRTVAFPGFTDTLVAGYNAATAQVFAETGYRFDTARASFEPYGAVAHVNVNTRGFTETGGAAALTTAPSTFSATFTTLGLRAETDIDIGDARKAKLTGGVGWRHAFGALVPATAASFAGGGAFTVTGVPVARDALVVELGADVDMGATTRLGFHYSGQIAAGASDHSFKASLAARF